MFLFPCLLVSLLWRNYVNGTQNGNHDPSAANAL